METISVSTGTESSDPGFQMPQQPPGMRQPQTFQTSPKTSARPRRNSILSGAHTMLTRKASQAPFIDKKVLRACTRSIGQYVADALQLIV